MVGSLAPRCPAGRLCQELGSRAPSVLAGRRPPSSLCFAGGTDQQPDCLLHASCPLVHLALPLCTHIFAALLNVTQGNISCESFTGLCPSPLLLPGVLKQACMCITSDSISSMPWDPPCDFLYRIIQKSFLAEKASDFFSRTGCGRKVLFFEMFFSPQWSGMSELVIPQPPAK